MPNGIGTVSIDSGVATFSTSQDGVLAVGALLTVAGITYRVTSRISATSWGIAYVTTPAPSAVSDLSLWLDASLGVTVRVDSGVDYVSGWDDQSGAARHYTNSFASYQGKRIANELNGRAVLRFGYEAGAAKWLTAGANALALWASAPGGSLFWVGKSTRAAGTQTAYPMNWNGILEPYRDNSANGRLGATVRRQTTDAATTPVGGTNVLTAWHVGAVRADFSNGKTLVRTNGTAGAELTLPTSGNADAASVTAGVIGTRSGGSPSSTNYWDGDVAAILAFRRVLTDTERWGVEAYLAQRYGLAVLGPQTQAFTYEPTIGASRTTTLSLTRTAVAKLRVAATRSALLPLVRTARAALAVKAGRTVTLGLVRDATARAYWLRPLRMLARVWPRAGTLPGTGERVADELSVSADYCSVLDVEAPDSAGTPAPASGITDWLVYLAATPTGAPIHDSLARPAAALVAVPGRYRVDFDAADVGTHLQPYVGRVVWECWRRPGDLVARLPVRVVP